MRPNTGGSSSKSGNETDKNLLSSPHGISRNIVFPQRKNNTNFNNTKEKKQYKLKCPDALRKTTAYLAF